MNRLKDATSPYLQQHADNPVDWWEWGPEAFAEAKRRDVPLLISVGYSACHWCHVMAHQSFEDPEVAAIVNALTVPVKVDRDQIVQAPLNVTRNAMQAIGAKGRIVLRTRALSNFVIGGQQHRMVDSIEIEDNGPGIPEEFQENIFFPLVTTKPDGTGIGLTIAQDLISGNGGLIEFDSRPGLTVFRIRFPAVLPGRVGGSKG